jgi:hypothetical protein
VMFQLLQIRREQLKHHQIGKRLARGIGHVSLF